MCHISFHLIYLYRYLAKSFLFRKHLISQCHRILCIVFYCQRQPVRAVHDVSSVVICVHCQRAVSLEKNTTQNVLAHHDFSIQTTTCSCGIFAKNNIENKTSFACQYFPLRQSCFSVNFSTQDCHGSIPILKVRTPK